MWVYIAASKGRRWLCPKEHLCRQVLAARRGGREALTEMAAQNARLVVGYCAKKGELKRIQEALAAERARWEVTLVSRLALKAMLGPCQSQGCSLSELVVFVKHVCLQ